MASYESSLSAEDRWALSHFVRSLGPKAPQDTTQDFAAIGVDVTQELAQEAVAQTISIDRALELMAEKGVDADRAVTMNREGMGIAIAAGKSAGAQVYGAYCLQCHGDQAQGAVIRNMGYLPSAPAHAVLETGRMGAYASVASAEQFARVVVKGLPGTVMPGQGQLSTSQIHELYQYVRSLPGAR
jgi:mono/diheme cytochrome c family protein